MPDVTPRSHARPAARHRAARPESPHGQDGRGGGVSSRLPRRRRDRLPDGRGRGEAYREAGADVLLLSMAHEPEDLRAIAGRLGGPLMYLAGRGGLAGMGMTLEDLGSLGYRIVADPSTPLLAAYATWKKVYDDLADGFGARSKTKPDWGPVEKDMLAVIGLEKLLAVERATVEKGKS